MSLNTFRWIAWLVLLGLVFAAAAGLIAGAG